MEFFTELKMINSTLNIINWIFDNGSFFFKTAASAYYAMWLFERILKLEKKFKPSYKVTMLNHQGIGRRNYMQTGPVHFLYTEFINKSTKSLCLSLYNLRNVFVTDSIVNARRRGVKVHFITDYHRGFLNNNWVNELRSEGKFYIHFRDRLCAREVM